MSMKGFSPMMFAVLAAIGVIVLMAGSGVLDFTVKLPAAMSVGSWQYSRETLSRGMPAPAVAGNGIAFGPCTGDVNLLGIEMARSCSVNNGAYAWQVFTYRGSGTITYTRAAYLACLPSARYRTFLALPIDVDVREDIFILKPIITFEELKTPTYKQAVAPGEMLSFDLSAHADALKPYEGRELALVFYVYTPQAGGCDTTTSRAYAAVKDVVLPVYCNAAANVEYRCRDNTREAKSVAVNCAETWAAVDVCPYGCEAGACKSAPVYVPPKLGLPEMPVVAPPVIEPPAAPPAITPPAVAPPAADMLAPVTAFINGIINELRRLLGI